MGQPLNVALTHIIVEYLRVIVIVIMNALDISDVDQTIVLIPFHLVMAMIVVLILYQVHCL